MTDHLPNTFLKSKSTEQLSRRQARWQIELSCIDPKWVYQKGQSNVADPLSRCPLLCCVSAPWAFTHAHLVVDLPTLALPKVSGIHSRRLANRGELSDKGVELYTLSDR